MVNDSILVTSPDLNKVILKRKAYLYRIKKQVTILKFEIEFIKSEYDRRIVNLKIELDELNLKLSALTYALINKQPLSEIMEMLNKEKAEKNFYDEEKITSSISDAEKVEIIKLYKKLAKRYHPDLTQDEEEKINRENIMKAINIAYANYNMSALINIEKEENELSLEFKRTNDIEDKLLVLERQINVYLKEIKELRKTPFYNWKLKIDKAAIDGYDYFESIETKLIQKIKNMCAKLEKLQKVNT